MRCKTVLTAVITALFLMGSGLLDPAPASEQTAKDLFEEGSRLAEQGDLDKAQQVFDQAVQSDPSMAGLANFRLGVAAAQRQNFEKAISYYEKALTFKANESVIYMNMANAFIAMGRPDKAIDAYNKLITLDPKAVWALHNLGSLYLQQKAYPAAIEAFNKVLEIDPNTYRTVYEQLGYAYQMVKNYPLAVTTYKKAVEMNPKSFTAHYNLGKCYFDMKEPDNSINYYLKAVDLNPKSAEAIANLGHAYYIKYSFAKNKTDLELAAAAFNRSLILNTNLGPALFGLAMVYREREDYQKALELAERARQAGLTISPKFLENLKDRINRQSAEGNAATKQAAAEPKEKEVKPTGTPVVKQNVPAEATKTDKKALDEKPTAEQAIPGEKKENNPSGKS